MTRPAATLLLGLWLALGPSARAAGDGSCPPLDPGPLGVLTTVQEANRVFLTQWGPNRWNSARPVWGFDDCGPTSSLMALAALGHLNPVAPALAWSWIGWMRDLEEGYHTTSSIKTDLGHLMAGLDRVGASRRIGTGLCALDAALAGGEVVILLGDPGRAWGRYLDARGLYLHRYGVGWGDRFNHWVAILGKNAAGEYLVGDPLSLAGVIRVRPWQIRAYEADTNGWPSFATAVR